MTRTTSSLDATLVLGVAAATAAVATALYRKKCSDQNKPKVEVTLPDWLHDLYDSLRDKEFNTDEEMATLAVNIASENVAKGTGGPFGCAIFQRDLKTKKTILFSVGANRVVNIHNSTTHAEMVAIQFAQQKLQSFTMNQPESGKEYLLVTSCEPCAMCLGGTHWSGVSELICSATKKDAEQCGFDEGPVFPQSYTYLQKSGMRVKKAINQPAGAAVFQRYKAAGGTIYQ